MLKNTQKKQTAVQFIRKMDNVTCMMEGIAQKTRETEDALYENVDPGVFDMNNLLDVNVQEIDDQPMLSMNKPRELSDGDKAQIVDEFAEILKKMPGDVIDFSDIGPIGTVIQTKLGFAQTLDGFLKDLISGAADSQNSQTFAKGTPTPGIAAVNQASASGAPVEDKSPTDIAPTKENIIDAQGQDTPIDPMAMGTSEPMDMGMEMDAPMDMPVDDLGLDVGSDDLGAVEDTLGDLSMDTPELTSSDDTGDADPIEDVDMDLGLDENEPKDESAPIEDDEVGAPEPTEGDIDDDFDFDADDEGEEQDELEAKLESVRDSFFSAERERKINSIMEAVMPKKTSVDTMLESTTESFHNKINEDKRVAGVTLALESIVAGIKKEKQTIAQLESIAAKVKKGEELGKKVDPKIATKTPAVDKVKKTVKNPVGINEAKEAKLASLVESYKKSQNGKARMEAIEARQKARAILDSLTK